MHFFSVSCVRPAIRTCASPWARERWEGDAAAARCPRAADKHADSGRGRPGPVTPPLPLYICAAVST